MAGRCVDVYVRLFTTSVTPSCSCGGPSSFTFPRIIMAISFQRICDSVSGRVRNCAARMELRLFRRCLRAMLALGVMRNRTLRSMNAESAMSFEIVSFCSPSQGQIDHSP